MTDKTSKMDSMLNQSWFTGITRPSRYVGAEINAITKDPTKTDVSVVLAFPDIYEVGMSHLGLKLLYHILNSQTWLSAERAFCPWVDLEKALVARELPLATMESHRPLSDFDIVGFSLQHELTFTNILSMLALSGIPFLSKERGGVYPLVIAGGPAADLGGGAVRPGPPAAADAGRTGFPRIAGGAAGAAVQVVAGQVHALVAAALQPSAVAVADAAGEATASRAVLAHVAGGGAVPIPF